MKTLLILSLFLSISLILTETTTTTEPSTWKCAQIFTNAAAPSGDCYPPTQGTTQLAGYYDVGGYGSAEIYCKLNFKNAVYQLRQCAFSKCMTSYGFDAMCLCQNCKGNYYDGNAPFRSFFATMLSTCSSGTPTVCAV